MTAHTKHFTSIGYAAQLLQATPKRIEDAARRASVEPAEVRNGVKQYTDEQLEAIRAELHKT